MSAFTIAQRLQLNWVEVPGVLRSILFEPSQGLEVGDLPTVYPVVLGRMTTAVPSLSAAPSIPLSAGQYAVERLYIYRAFLAQATSASIDSGDFGAYINEVSATFMDAPIDYFMRHPRLNTDAGLSDIPQLVRDVTIQDSGLVPRQDVAGKWHICVDYTFTIAERRIPSPKRIS